MKKFFIFAIFCLIVSLFFPLTNISAASGTEAYKAIVKIYTYLEDDSYYLTPFSSGSGVMISSSGIILTNAHVVSAYDYFDNEVPTAFVVCLTATTTDSPSCDYSADLIVKDDDQDIALLKIKNIGLNNKPKFDYLNRVNQQGLSGNDMVYALGYPGIGGETITETNGIISGTTQDHGYKWLKTSALTSFGSSGGALIDANGSLIGITTQAYSDFLGALGYAIDITSINKWIDANTNKSLQISKLQARMESFIKKSKQLETATFFTNDLPKLSINKPADWEIFYDKESQITITDPGDENSGLITLSWIKNDTDADLSLDATVKTFTLTDSYYFVDKMAVAQKTAYRLVSFYGSEEISTLLLGSNNYGIILVYYNGTDNQDENLIKQTIASLQITDTPYTKQRQYKNNEPYFEFITSDDWSLLGSNSVIKPVAGQTDMVPEAGFAFNIREITPTMQQMSNQEYFNYIKDDDLIKDNYESSFSLKAVKYQEDFNYRLNNELTNEIHYKYKFIDENENDQVKFFASGWRVRDNDRVLVISLSYVGDDQTAFEKVAKKFEDEVLVNLTLGRNVVDAPTDPTPPATPSAPVEPSASPVLDAKNLTNTFAKSLIGKILLQVESHGEAWYLSPKTNKAYFLGRPADAFNVMREQGVGISNVDLNKIPIGLTELSGADSDNDGLSDIFEDAIGSDKNKADTDGDGNDDKTEVLNNTNPNGTGRMPINYTFTKQQKGKIFLQIESHGEAWYVNPADGKRYFLGRPADAFSVMRFLGLGISDDDFYNIE